MYTCMNEGGNPHTLKKLNTVRGVRRKGELEELKNIITTCVQNLRSRAKKGEVPRDYKVFDPTNFMIDQTAVRMWHTDVNLKRGLKRFPRMRESTTNNISTIGKRVVDYTGRKKAELVELVGITEAQQRVEFIRKWEEMICQTSWNIVKISEATEPRVKSFFSKCYFDYETGHYYAGSNQCMDLQIVKHTPDQVDTDPRKHIAFNEKISEFLPDVRGGSYEGAETHVYETQEKAYYFQEKTPVGSPYIQSPISTPYGAPSIIHPTVLVEHDYSVMVNSDVINSNLMRDIRAECRGTAAHEGPVYLFKTLLPGPHFALSIYYPLEKRIEFFDPGGSWGGGIGYRDALGNEPYSLTLEKLRSGRRGRQSSGGKPWGFAECKGYGGGGDPVEDAICIAFQNLFGHPDGVEFVAINIVNLQPTEEDAHCQVWVWLYVYIKFVLNVSTKNTLKYLSLLNRNELLTLIEHWREYLLYFDLDDSDAPPNIP